MPMLQILLNDLPGMVQSSLCPFTDDSKIFGSITTIEDLLMLQNINFLLEWCS